MLKFFSPKVYRKFMILTVLSGSLFMFSSMNQAAALPCCSDVWEACDNTYASCVATCEYLYQQNPARKAQCIGICEDQQFACYTKPCSHGC